MKLTRFFSLSLIFIFLTNFVSATNQVIIYLDSQGQAQFLGNAANLTNFPSGISLTNGKLSGTTIELTSKSKDVWTFVVSIPNTEMQVFLPANSLIYNTNGEVSIINGRISVYSQDYSTITYSIKEANPSSNFVYIILILALITIAAVIYFLLRRSKNKNLKKLKPQKEKNKINKEKILKNILNEKQNLILGILRKQGSMKSSFLRRVCNMPKASFSRHITELEKKNLIKRTGLGRNKLIELA